MASSEYYHCHWILLLHWHWSNHIPSELLRRGTGTILWLTQCQCSDNGPLARYVKMRVVHTPGMPGTFSSPPRVSDADMHHGTCKAHVPWWMSGSLTRGFFWSQWEGKRSRHSRRMREPRFYVSGKRPIKWKNHYPRCWPVTGTLTKTRCFLWCASEQTAIQTMELSVIWDTITSWCPCDVTVMVWETRSHGSTKNW